MKINNIQILIFVLLFFTSSNNFVYSQTCENGYYYITGIGCRLTAPGILNIAYCQHPTTSDYYKTLTATPNYACPSGYTTYQSKNNNIITNSFVINQCSQFVTENSMISFSTIGNCPSGSDDQLIPMTISFTDVNRYLVLTRCQISITFVDSYFEVRSTPTASSGAYCAEKGYSFDGTATVLSFMYWDFGVTKCPIGYSGPLPCTLVGCPAGYKLNADGKTCDEINECTAGTSGCSHTCSNTAGSFTCSCPNGYRLGSDLKTCSEINECIENTDGCSHTCTNTDGSFTCSCPNGYKLGSDLKTCSEIDECTENTDGCAHTCTNLPLGSFTCSCNSGYTLSSEDSKTCLDNDECSSSQLNSCTGIATCSNTIGSYECKCPFTGYTLSADGFSCIDIDECLTAPSTIQCGENTVCSNTIGSYECSCLDGFLRVSPTECQSKPIVSKFYQNPTKHYSFIVQGFNFNSNSIITIKPNQSGSAINCQYQSGTSNEIECTTKEGVEVIGSVTVESDSLLSDPIEFSGAPFLVSYSKSPLTNGGDEVTFSGRNLPTIGNIKLTINSIDCQIISSQGNENITITVPEGSGSFNYVSISNETVSNTDNSYITYASPFILSTSVVYENGGILTVTGKNFGLSTSEVTVDIGSYQCVNVKVLSHNQLTCELEAATKIKSDLVSLVVDGLPVENQFYFSHSQLDEQLQDCNGNGKSTPTGCVCNDKFIGVTCNETSVGITPSLPSADTPSIEIGNGNGNNNGFGYKITILRIEELDFNNVVINESITQLSTAKWNSMVSTDQQNWKFNITLLNKSYLEANFEYFKQSKNITFASNSFIIPAESIKLSLTTKQWPFQSKLNTLRVVIETETLIENDNVNECSIDGAPATTTKNQHLWSTTKNSESGLVARFISNAELDSIYSITSKIEDLSDYSNGNIKSSIIGISVPFFSKQSIIDPDFSMLLNVNQETGNCKSTSNNVNWKLATGLSIGGAGVVCLGVAATYFVKLKKKNQKLQNLFTNRSQ